MQSATSEIENLRRAIVLGSGLILFHKFEVEILIKINLKILSIKANKYLLMQL